MEKQTLPLDYHAPANRPRKAFGAIGVYWPDERMVLGLCRRCAQDPKHAVERALRYQWPALDAGRPLLDKIGQAGDITRAQRLASELMRHDALRRDELCTTAQIGWTQATVCRILDGYDCDACGGLIRRPTRLQSGHNRTCDLQYVGYTQPPAPPEPEGENPATGPTRVALVTFQGQGHVALQAVLTAFCRPFPSLSAIPTTAEVLLRLAASQATDDDVEAIHAAIRNSQDADRWPARIEVQDNTDHWITRRGPGEGEDERVVIVRPYVGDRVLRLTVAGNGTWTAVADYTARPSAQAAEAVLALVDWRGMRPSQHGDHWVAVRAATVHPLPGAERLACIEAQKGE